MLLHMLWNSGLLSLTPQNIGFFQFTKYLWLVSVVGSWYLALLLVQQGLNQIQEAKASAFQPLTDVARSIELKKDVLVKEAEDVKRNDNAFPPQMPQVDSCDARNDYRFFCNSLTPLDCSFSKEKYADVLQKRHLLSVTEAIAEIIEQNVFGTTLRAHLKGEVPAKGNGPTPLKPKSNRNFLAVALILSIACLMALVVYYTSGGREFFSVRI